MIDRVEIVKGPASGLYGSEAVGGLINIITKMPGQSPRFSMDVMATSWNEFQADASVAGKLGKKFHGMLGLHSYWYQDPRDMNGDRFTDLTQQKRISLFTKWSAERPGGRVASMGFRYYLEDRWGGEVDWNRSYRGTDIKYGESIYTQRLEWIGQYQLPVALPLVFQWSYNYHHQDSYYGITPFMARQHIGFGQLTTQRSLGSHDLLAGVAGRYTRLDDNTAATVGNIQGVFLPGLFVQDEWKLNERHTLLSGLRYDHHPLHGNILTPRLAWKWKTGKNGVFRANAGTGFRVVNVFTEDHAALTGAREVVISETLDPEQSYNINLNYGYRLPVGSGVMNIDASAWYTYFTNRIIPDYDTDPNKIIYQNLDGYSVSRGLSANLSYDWGSRLRVLLGATFQDVYLREQTAGKWEQTRPMLVERWSGVWTLSYQTPVKGLGLDYTGSIYGPMRLPLAGELDPRSPFSPVWSLQNLQVTYKRGKMEWYAGVKNLLNWTPAKSTDFLIARAHDPFDKQVQYGTDGKIMATPENPYALSFDPGYVYAPNQGRRVFMGARFALK
jgi:outer membrane receptor for ferrienterochelin and colicins